MDNNDQTVQPVEQPVESVKDEPSTPIPVASKSNINFKVDLEYSTPLDKLPDNQEYVDMPTTNIGQIKEVLSSVIDKKLADGKEANAWLNTLNQGAQQAIFDDGLNKTTAREGASFTQKVISETGDLNAGIPKFKSKEGVKYTGEAARMRLRSNLGLGTAFTFPLWHSGFWITIKTPTEAALLELYREITSEKISLGRSVYGLMFSNSTSYTSKILLDFVLDNLYNTTLNVPDNDDIRNYIRVQDLPILIWGIACATWPKGFPYQRACIVDPDKCKHVITEKLDLKKLQWTDTSSLSTRQINHMSNRTANSMSLESVKLYVDEFTRGINKTVKLSDNGSVTLKVPTAHEHIEAGQKWISSIEERYGRSMLESENDREKYLYNQARATAMRQYSHFLKSLNVLDEEYDDRDIIDTMLDDMSSEDSFRDAFMEACSDFIDESIVSLIAIPTYKCPNCGMEQAPNRKKGVFSSLIAIDVAQTFFTLLVQKLTKIENR
jgi:hypothetical protein